MAWRSVGRPRAGGYWLQPFADGVDRRVAHLVGTVGVREALAEVHRAGGGGEARHLGEDRRAETLEAGVEEALAHRPRAYVRYPMTTPVTSKM